ncbi:MAG TPA: VOC family protein [Edaphobacter sp.]
MLAQHDPIGFILTVDAERSRSFYVDLLGLTFIADEHYSLVLRGKGIELRLVRMDSFSPASHTVFGWEVPVIEKVVRDLAAAGVTFERYPYLEQDEAGVWTAPDRKARVAWFKDPDGNVLSVSQHG